MKQLVGRINSAVMPMGEGFNLTSSEQQERLNILLTENRSCGGACQGRTCTNLYIITAIFLSRFGCSNPKISLRIYNVSARKRVIQYRFSPTPELILSRVGMGTDFHLFNKEFLYEYMIILNPKI